MRFAVFDTNVIIAAAISRTGIPSQLIHDWVLQDEVRLVVCPFVVREYREVVRRPKFLRYDFPPDWLESLIEDSLHVRDPQTWPMSIPHREDGIFLALAHATKAWLVTGNLRHFPASVRRGVIVLSPADYLAQLTSR